VFRPNDACVDDLVLNPPGGPFTIEEFYLPDFTVATARPSPTPLVCRSTALANYNVRSAPNLQGTPFLLTSSRSVIVSGRTHPSISPTWYRISGWDPNDAQAIGWIIQDGTNPPGGLSPEPVECTYLPLYNDQATPEIPTATPTASSTPTRGPSPTASPTATQTATNTPIPVITLSPTPTLIACTARIIQTIGNQNVLLRDIPAGNGIEVIPSNATIPVYGGWNLAGSDGGPSPEWWWYTERNGKFGYVNASFVDDFNSCPRTLVQPPQPLAPAPYSPCFVKLTAASAQVVDANNNVIDTLTDQSVLIRVYGRSDEAVSERYLISEPGAVLPQRWVTTSLFRVEPAYAYGCQPKALGKFRYTSDQEYWSIIGTYANGFAAPVSFTDYPYQTLRNTQYFIKGGQHTGIDLIYAPPNGLGTPLDFTVRAQYDGVVVDAGPSGITGRFAIEGLTTHPFPGRAGTYYDDGIFYFAVTWKNDWDEQNDRLEKPASGYDFTDPDFGLTAQDLEFITLLNGQLKRDGSCTQLAGWPSLNPPPPLPGCVAGSDRQMIIWYDSDNNDGDKADIQTVYYHIQIDGSQYETWNTICTQLDRQDTWVKVRSGIPQYAACNVAQGQPLGVAEWIGWSSDTHLHYEVFVDGNHNGEFERIVGVLIEREDPITAFATFR
jgi:hypothetical protein